MSPVKFDRHRAGIEQDQTFAAAAAMQVRSCSVKLLHGSMNLCQKTLRNESLVVNRWQICKID